MSRGYERVRAHDTVPTRYSHVVHYLENGVWWNDLCLNRDDAELRAQELRAQGHVVATVLHVSDDPVEHLDLNDADRKYAIWAYEQSTAGPHGGRV